MPRAPSATGAIAARATRAFQDEFISASGRVVSDTATSIAVALVFDLFASADQAERAGERLRELVGHGGFHISTGFVGTPIICDALVLSGSMDYAYHLLLQEGLPSWLYPVTMGATTIWERWDSMLPDGSINPGDMTSFNHYALGAVADFLHRSVAGLSSDAPGWEVRAVRAAPRWRTRARVGAVRQRPGNGGHRVAPGRRDADDRGDGARGIPRNRRPARCAARRSRSGPGRHSFRTSFRAVADDPEAPFFGWRREPVDA